MERRRFALVLALAALAALAASAATCSSTPATPTPVRFSYLASADQLPYFVMQEEGFAARNGIRLEGVSAAGGAASIEQLASGTADAAFPGAFPLMSAAAKGTVPGKMVAVAAVGIADPAHPSGAVLASKAVESWADLEGKRVAVNAPGSIGHLAVRERFRLEEVEAVAYLNVPFQNMGLAVAGGNVDAAVMFEPYLTQSLLRGDGKLLDWVIGGKPFERFHVSSLVVSAAFQRAHPDAVRGLLRAHFEAVRWIGSHESAAREMLTRRLGLTQEVGRRMRMPQFSPDGRHDAALLAAMQETLLREGILPARLDPASLYDERPLRRVLAELG